MRIDGTAIAREIRQQIAEAAEALRRDHGVVPGLRLYVLGDDAASVAFVERKAKLGRKAGINAEVVRLAGDVSPRALLDDLAAANADDTVDGVLVQLPLPAGHDADAVARAVAPAKDVDGLHPFNLGLLAAGSAEALVPPTAWGVGVLLRRTLGDDLAGMTALVAGRSLLVGRPVAYWLLREDCTVTVAHSRTRDLPALCREAQILVVAIGQPEYVRGEWVRPGATVIDVGLTGRETPSGEWRMVGDVRYDEVETVAAHVTPVPGGVGPMTVAGVLANTVVAACRRRGLPAPSFR